MLLTVLFQKNTFWKYNLVFKPCFLSFFSTFKNEIIWLTHLNILLTQTQKEHIRQIRIFLIHSHHFFLFIWRLSLCSCVSMHPFCWLSKIPANVSRCSVNQGIFPNTPRYQKIHMNFMSSWDKCQLQVLSYKSKLLSVSVFSYIKRHQNQWDNFI